MQGCAPFWASAGADGLLSLEDLLGVAISAGVGMLCALFLDMAVYVTALQNNS